MEDFNAPQKRQGIDENFKKFAVDLQIDNICKLLGGEAKRYYCSDKTTEHEKIIIEFNDKQRKVE